MDLHIANLRRNYHREPSHHNAMRLAGTLLRVAPLETYVAAAQIGDAEAQELLMHMRAIELFEDLFDEFVEENGRVRFRDPETGATKYKFINVYCHNQPLASVRIETFDEGLATKQFLEKHFSSQDFLLPPEPLRLDKSSARALGGKTGDELLVVSVFVENYCEEPRFLAEDEPCFDFSREDAPPISIWVPGAKEIMMRPLIDEDYTTVDTDFQYYETVKDFEYSELPPFAKPADEEDEPSFAIARLVTRHQTRGIDGPGWDNYGEPVAKIYLGYVFPYWAHNWSWSWTEKLYDNQCNYTDEEVQGAIEHSNATGTMLDPQELEPCLRAGIPQIEERKRSRCPFCRNYVDSTLHQAAQLVTAEHAEDTIPAVPAYINETLSFLQELFDHEIKGDIYSVLGGQDLSVSVSAETYGPYEDSSRGLR